MQKLIMDDICPTTTPCTTPDSIELYLREIRHSSLLSKEDEFHYGQLAQQGDQKARQHLIKSNLRLVVKVARRYLNSGLHLNDLIEEGNIGLIRAIDRFNPSLGFRFSTYGVWWIQESIENAIINYKTVRLPIYLVKKLNTRVRENKKHQPLEQHTTKLLDLNQRQPSHSSLLETTLLLNEAFVSLDAPVSDEQDRSLSETLSDETSDPASSHYLKHLQDKISQWLAHLTTKQRAVVERRFGLNGHDELTLEQTGEILSLTRERVRQIQTEALKILRHLLVNQGDNLNTLLPSF